MANGSSFRKSVSKGEGNMHQENYFPNIDTYNEFIQCYFYVNETHLNPPLIIFKPASTNPMENQS